MSKFICVCGAEFERPEEYEVYNKNFPNVFWKWKLTYCDVCIKNKTIIAMQHLPNIIKSIVNDNHA